jgi:hypothetical protein
VTVRISHFTQKWTRGIQSTTSQCFLKYCFPIYVKFLQIISPLQLFPTKLFFVNFSSQPSDIQHYLPWGKHGHFTRWMKEDRLRLL